MGFYVDMCEYIVSLFLLQINEKMCFCLLLVFNPVFILHDVEV